MSHSQREKGLVGTITIGPDASTKVYPNQALYIEAKVVMTTGTIPDGATINFDGGANKSLYFVGLPDDSNVDVTNVPIVIDPSSHNTTGTARLCIRHDYTDTTNTIVVNAVAGTAWTGPKPIAAQTVTYTLATNDPIIVCSGPTTTLLQQPKPADGDQLTPAAAQYTTSFTCTVKDGATPVPGYVVEWHEGRSVSLALFAADDQGLVNPYTSGTATWADRVPTNTAVIVDGDTNGGSFIRMTTDANGVASLYLVAKASAGPIAQSVEARYDFKVTYEYPRPFLVMNIDSNDYSGTYPGIEDPLTEEIGDTFSLDFSQLISPPNVSVNIPQPSNWSKTEDVFLVLNNAIVGGPYHYAKHGLGVECRFLASLAFSDLMPNGKNNKNPTQNEILFVVGQDNGIPLASNAKGFYGKGDNIELTGGDLDAPTLYPGARFINPHTLAAGAVSIRVDLKPKDQSYIGAANDVITATAILTGYKPNSDAVRVPVSVTANVLPPLTDDDVLKGYVLLHFPAAPFQGWDRQKDYPQTMGQCCIVYTVYREGEQAQTSTLLTVMLDTVNQSYTAA